MSSNTASGEGGHKMPVSFNPWCRDAWGGAYTIEQYRNKIESFHGYPAPGLFIGGKMVDMALSRLPEGRLFDAISETGNCLPDAIQVLTPCTIGNGWLRVFTFGKFALSLYDKQTGRGVRVYLDPEKLSGWKEIDSWFFRKIPKAQQDRDALESEIFRAGDQILEAVAVQVHPAGLAKAGVGERNICPRCGESYPLRHGALCRACAGASPYIQNERQE